MTCRGELPAKRHPWAYDNGAFRDWKAQRPWNADAFERDLDVIARAACKPDFVCVPDVVAGGWRSLDLSIAWACSLNGLAPRYLAVQDGMSTAAVAEALGHFEGVFVGGSLTWKIRTGRQWVELAHAHGKPCHVGRVGGLGRVQWARRIKADSIDSCLPLWSEEKLGRFIEGLSPESQSDLFHPVAEGWAPPPEFWRGMGVPEVQPS